MRTGYIENDTWVSPRRPDQVFRMFTSFGISIPILEELRKKGIEKVKFPVKEWNCAYETSVSTLLNSALEFKDSLGSKSKHIRLTKMVKIPL